MTALRLRPMLAAAASMAALLSACTGVPESSAPQVIQPVSAAKPNSPPPSLPVLNADARSMVQDFLSAGSLADARHATARGFLSPDAKNRWSDATVTVIDAIQIGNLTNGSITVRGRRVGAVNPLGIYAPELAGDGSGGVSVPFTFGMKKLDKQWRIDTLPSGLILSYREFQRIYQQRNIYFWDLTEKHLIPDPRYSSLVDRSALADWLLAQLITGPRPELQNAWTREVGLSDPRRLRIILGSPTTIELPGTSQLDLSTREHVAGQLALTLDPLTSAGSEMSIIDGGRPVAVLPTGGTRFSASTFSSAVNPANTAPALFYIHGGAVVDSNGKPLPGQLGTAVHRLRSVALASTPGSEDLLAAGTTGPAADTRLLVGTANTGLRATSLHGRLSRPSWAPNLHEVWVGNGSKVFQVMLGGRATEVPVAGAGALTGRVSAVRFSPEGSRVALVVTASDGASAQVWVGSVVRPPAQAQVRVDSLEPISPQLIAVTDVAWNDQLKLFTVGRNVRTGDANVYEVQVDGSLWSPRSLGGLPGVPDSITVAEHVPAWVSVGNTVWRQRGGSWASPDSEAAAGTNPTYLE